MRTVPGSTPAPKSRAVISALFSTFFALCLLIVWTADADAKKRRKSYKNPKYAAYVIDANTGKVLHSRNANALRYPASLTKMMTLYLVFEDLHRGKIKKSSRVVMSRNAAKRPPSKLGIRPGRSISVEQAILALVTKSANDVSTAVAEKLSGSEAAFARRMTKKARELGMRRTTFKNANGLTAKGQLTTAADMARLGLALREHFPREFRYFKTRVFKYGRARMGNHNRLLGRVKGVDGIKTGYTRASGYNLVSSVSTGGRRIVAVVMGGRTGARRNAAMTRLIRAYLPKAKRGKGRMLIAKRAIIKPKAVAVANLTLPKNAPKPSFSPNSLGPINKRIQVAHQSTTVTSAEISKVQKKLAALGKVEAPVPDSRPTKAADPVRTASLPEAPSGWQIQISAAESEAKAKAMLAKARKKGRSALRRTSTFIQPVVKGGTTLYRARFVNFSSKRAAKNACRTLKRSRFNCIALKV